jgi:hypothetical protein
MFWKRYIAVESDHAVPTAAMCNVRELRCLGTIVLGSCGVREMQYYGAAMLGSCSVRELQ